MDVKAVVERIKLQKHNKSSHKIVREFFTAIPSASSGGSRKFWWGGFEAKNSKIRMSSPKLRVIFWPKSEIQTFFRPKSGGLQTKKKKKGLHQN